MGDIPSPSTPSRRPGIAIVRPKLHSNTPQNRDLFMRWTKLHLRDTLSLPPDPDFGRVTKMLRFKRADANGEEVYLFTNHFEDLRLLREGELPAKTSQRLDLENVRALGEGEVAVLEEGDERVGKKSMVYDIVAPSVGVFREVANGMLFSKVRLDSKGVERADCLSELFDHSSVQSYQELPSEIATVENAPDCTLITLTISPVDRSADEADLRYIQKISKLQLDLVDFLRTATQRSLYTTMYQYELSARPEGLPDILECQHGDGRWVVCVLIDGNTDLGLAEVGYEGVEGQVIEWEKRMKLNGNMEGLDVRVGTFEGDVFMS